MPPLLPSDPEFRERIAALKHDLGKYVAWRSVNLPEEAWHGDPSEALVDALCADLSAFGPGRTLDDDANVLLRLSGGARAVLVASQINTGVENGFRLRVSGTQGSLEWWQEQPSRLVHSPLDGPPRLLTRGSPWLHEAAKRASRLPSGHPEGFIEAFANVYLGVAGAIRARANGIPEDPLDADYPTVEEGARGVRFIEAVLASAGSDVKWTPVRD